jgi:TPP-dependent 2-oxoacid decarboxylase
MAASQVTAQQCLLQTKWQGNKKALSVQLNPIMVAPKQEIDNSKNQHITRQYLQQTVRTTLQSVSIIITETELKSYDCPPLYAIDLWVKPVNCKPLEGCCFTPKRA